MIRIIWSLPLPYLYLNDMDVDYLDDHDYSREEILDGLKSLAEDWGVTGLEALV